jgi:hypothetical protein
MMSFWIVVFGDDEDRHPAAGKGAAIDNSEDDFAVTPGLEGDSLAWFAALESTRGEESHLNVAEDA